MSVFQFRRLRKNKNKDIEPHEVFIDNLAQEREEEYGVSKRRLEVPLARSTVVIFMICVFFVFSFLFLRSAQLQIIEGDRFSAIAQRNKSTVLSMQLLRGVIYDRNMEQLAYNSPRFDLYFGKDKLFLEDKEMIKEIAEIIDAEKDEILEKMTAIDSGQALIKKNLNHEEMVMLQARIMNFPGFSISGNMGREYKEGEIFSHILGYIGKVDQETLSRSSGKYMIHDYVGKTGIERFYEDYLTRSKTRIKLEHDSSGNIKAEELIESEEQGRNLVLTIDGELQRIIVDATERKIWEIGAEKGAVVAINPQTGEILSMVSIPSFDNNIFQQEIDHELFATLFEDNRGAFINRVTSALYSTGSIIKPLLAIAALEEEIISPSKKIHSPGYISIPNPWNPALPTIFRDYQAHGWTDIRQAIAVSSNVYFYSIGGGYEDQEGLGVGRIKKYLELFGWGEKVGIDLPGEKGGFIPSSEWKMETMKDAWRIGDTYNLSIGQGYLSATPLQVAVAYASLVNGGKLLSPYLLKEIVNDDGQILQEAEPKIIRDNLASPENLNIVKEGMRETTISGTAKALQNLPVVVGAKTGTTEIPRQGHYHNWITVFAPYEDPEIVITIIVEEVEGIQSVTGPLALEILQWYFE